MSGRPGGRSVGSPNPFIRCIMHAARIIVCEKTGRWATALRRVLSATRPRMCQTRSMAECLRELERSPASLIALELTAENGSSVVEFLDEVHQRFHRAIVVVFGPRAMERCGWLVREAGAVHAVFSPREVASAARVIERHLQRAPTHPLTLRQSLWSRLPWGGG